MLNDITMCRGENCKIKYNCLRYTVSPDKHQSWFVRSPIRNGKCEYFLNKENAHIAQSIELKMHNKKGE